LVAGYFAYRAVWPAAKWSDAAAMAFDAAAVVFLASLIPLLRDSSAEAIRDHAARNDANRPLILVVTTFLMFVAMSLSLHVSRLEERVEILAEEVAFLRGVRTPAE
jgi:uncharacterized membrane protein